MDGVPSLGFASQVSRTFSMVLSCLDMLWGFSLLSPSLCSQTMLRFGTSRCHTSLEANRCSEPGETEPCKALKAVWIRGSCPSSGRPWHYHLAGSLLTDCCPNWAKGQRSWGKSKKAREKGYKVKTVGWVTTFRSLSVWWDFLCFDWRGISKDQNIPEREIS